MMTYCFI